MVHDCAALCHKYLHPLCTSPCAAAVAPNSAAGVTPPPGAAGPAPLQHYQNAGSQQLKQPQLQVPPAHAGLCACELSPQQARTQSDMCHLCATQAPPQTSFLRVSLLAMQAAFLAQCCCLTPPYTALRLADAYRPCSSPPLLSLPVNILPYLNSASWLSLCLPSYDMIQAQCACVSPGRQRHHFHPRLCPLGGQLAAVKPPPQGEDSRDSAVYPTPLAVEPVPGPSLLTWSSETSFPASMPLQRPLWVLLAWATWPTRPEG